MKWYKKATVQQAIVNAIPVFVTAFIAAISLVTTCNNSNKQLELNMEQYHRDSLNSMLQFQLITKQNNIAARSYLFDSLVGDQQLQIAKAQLSIIIKESLTKQTANWIKLRSTILKIFDTTPKGGFELIKNFTLSQKHQLADTLDILLNSEINNPILIANKKCLGYWMNAVTISNHLDYTYTCSDFDLFEKEIEGIINSIMKVDFELIFYSKELPIPDGKGNWK
jgi:hypothetical protein